MELIAEVLKQIANRVKVQIIVVMDPDGSSQTCGGCPECDPLNDSILETGGNDN